MTKVESSNPIIIGHRGAPTEAPENSIPSLEKAKELGCQYAECDIQLTLDGHPVIFHPSDLGNDPLLKRGIASANDVTLEQFRSLDLGSWFSSSFKGTKGPTLSEYLDAIGDNFGAMLELKKSNRKQETLLLKEVVRELKGRDYSNYVVGSFSPFLVESLKRELPRLSVIAIANKIKEFDQQIELSPDYFALDYKMVTAELMRRAKEKNIEVWCWTVDDINEGKKLLELGVRGLITNRAREFLEEFSTPPSTP